MVKRVNIWILPVVLLVAIGLDLYIGNASNFMAQSKNYLAWFIGVLGFCNILLIVISYYKEEVREWLEYWGLFSIAMIILLTIYNIATKKLGLLPGIFFPSLDKILGVIVEDHEFILLCLITSGKLLATGFILGAAAGFITGLAVGFSKTAEYWISPIIRFIGPMPPTAWIPVVLVVFPTTFAGSSFLIALSVWFPVTLMTSSGIKNLPQAYFEVASTLGAGKYYQIFRVGVPAAMPSVFLGLFNGACASFITLMTAELLGVKNGIGWYINWQKDMMAYANVYAGLIIISVTFFLIILLLFKFREHVLGWQKGVIKW